MNEMQLLERLGSEVEPDPAVLRRARRHLLRRALVPQARRRRGARRVLIGAAAAAVTAAALVVGTTLPDGGGAEAAAVEVLERASSAADATVVGPGQWLHVTSETTRWYDDGPEHSVQETWVPGDPRRDTRWRNEGVVVLRPLDLPAIAEDPDVDTDDVYAWLMRDSGDLRGADAAFERAGETLADDAVPAAFKARLFDAIARIDGSRVVDEQADFAERDAVLIGRVEGDWETQLAFDATSGEFIGFQGLVDGSPSYRTLMTSEVVDALPARARSCVVELDEEGGYSPPPECATD